MNIYKHNGGSIYYCRFNLNKKTYVRSTGLTDKSLAREWAFNLRNSLIAKKSEKEELAIADCLNEYHATIAKTPFGRPSKSYLTFILSDLEDVENCSDLTSLRINRMVDTYSKTHAPQTTKHMLSFLKRALARATRLGYAVPEVEYPSITVKNQRQRYLTKDEEKRFLDALSPDRTWTKMGEVTEYQRQGMQKAYDFGLALLDLGGRNDSEVLKLRWEHVDLKNGTVMLWRSKTNTGTTLTMTNRLKEMFARRYRERGDNPYVFGKEDGSITRTLSRRIKNAIVRAGIENFRPYDIRHTTASRLVQAGCSLPEIAIVLGHSHPNTSARYSHLVKTDVADKAALILNKLNGRK
jgi:integrase